MATEEGLKIRCLRCMASEYKDLNIIKKK